jgi:bla regulator protein blaR1
MGEPTAIRLKSRLMQMVLVVPLVCGLSNAAGTQTDSAAGKTPSYDVASIKPAKPGDVSTLLFRPGRLTANGFTLKSMIKQAYGIEDQQIAGAPGWVDTQRFDVEAKVDGVDAATLENLSEDQTKLMFQSFLKDRFGLKGHRETRELPVLVLVVAKGGTRLKEAKPGDTYANGIKGPDGQPAGHAGMMRFGRGQLTGQGISIAALVPPLTQQLGRTVVDKTGLTGQYDVELRWTPDDAPGPIGSQGEAGVESTGPSILTALQEQLGLKLESRKSSVEVLVIDHVEPPSTN